jgi:TRAP-type C4-dicarboxylate transport system substrate-binding protein
MKNLLMTLLLLSSWSVSAKIKVKFATVAPAGTPWANVLDRIKKDVTKNSKGEIKLKVYMGGQLGGELETLRKVRSGSVQGGGFTSGALGSVIPELNVLEIPFIFENNEEADFILDNYLLKPFAEMFEKKGMVLVAWSENGWRSIGHKSKAIKSPKDLVGEKMRSQESPVHLAFWKAMNASPQALPVTNVLESLNTGVVNGFDNTPLFTMAAEWHTQIKHYSVTNHIYQPGAILYSKKWWDKKLNDKQRKILMGKGNAWAPESRIEIRAMGDELVATLGELGVNIHKLSANELNSFKDVLTPLQQKMVKELGGRSQEIYDLIQKGKKEFKKQ